MDKVHQDSASTDTNGKPGKLMQGFLPLVLAVNQFFKQLGLSVCLRGTQGIFLQSLLDEER